MSNKKTNELMLQREIYFLEINMKGQQQHQHLRSKTIKANNQDIG